MYKTVLRSPFPRQAGFWARRQQGSSGAPEQVYRFPDALEFPGGFLASMSMSFWYDLKKELKVAETSWRIDRTRKETASESFLPVVVGSAEQFLDHVASVSQRRGWFSGEAQTKKAQALSAASQ